VSRPVNVFCWLG